MLIALYAVQTLIKLSDKYINSIKLSLVVGFIIFEEIKSLLILYLYIYIYISRFIRHL